MSRQLEFLLVAHARQKFLLAWSRLWSKHEMTGQRSRGRLWWARLRQVQSVWEGLEADNEGEGHGELYYTGIIHHFSGHFSLTRSQNASFHQTYESAQVICHLILWTASQVIADSSASLVSLIRRSESSPLLITLCFEKNTNNIYTLYFILPEAIH